MADLRATPYANPLTGLSNDVIQGLLGYMKDKQRTQQMQGLASLLESTGIPKTVERAAYAESPTGLLNALTNVNRANVPLLKPETADALMTLAPVPSGANKAAMAAGRAGERYAEKVVPQILERGGLPAGLLQDLAQGSRSHIFIPATKDEALKASKMLKSGKSEKEVWKEIGVGKAPDGEWRKELSDKKAEYDPEAFVDLKINNPEFDYLKDTQPLAGVMGHSELYKQLPYLEDIPVHFMPNERMKGAYAAYSPKHNAITVGDSHPEEKYLSSLLHETQHAIQEKEGFAVGGNARDFAKLKYEANQKIDELNNQMRSIVKKLDDPSFTKEDKAILRSQYDQIMEDRQNLVSSAQLDPMQMYGHLMGEAEARLTQRRMNLTPEERLVNYPFEYTGNVGYGLDVKPEDLIQMSPEGTIIKRGLLGP